MRSTTVSLLVALTVTLPMTAMADEVLDTHIQAFAVSVDEAGKTVKTPASSIEPGGIIEYAMVYENMSENTLANLVVMGKIPEQTQYIAQTESVDLPSVFEAKTSGIDWSTPPLMTYVENDLGVLEAVEIPPSEYTDVRWKIAQPLTAGAEFVATYRVRVNQ